MKYLILTIAAFSWCATGLALAQQEADLPEKNTQANETDDTSFGKYHRKLGKRAAKKAERMFSKVDGNEDGQVDLNEFLAHSEQRFQRMDLNGDGYVTLVEAKDAHKAMRKEYREAKKARKERRSEDAE